MTKRTKNIKNNVAVNCVDSTQPVSKIIDYFATNNTPIFRHYCKVVGRRPQDKRERTLHYLTPGHPLNSFKDEWDGVLPSRYFEQFTYKSTLPKIITTMAHRGCTDPVTDFMKKKLNWKKKVSFDFIGIETGKYMSKFQRLNDKVIRCPKNMVQAAVDLESDPLPHFDSSYNWYYSGNGNMHLISLNGVDYVLHSELHILYLTRISLDHLKVEDNYIFSYNCNAEENILETIYSDDRIVAIRTRFKVIILKILVMDLNMITIVKLKEIENTISYTSISFDPYHENILYVTTLDNNVTIVNMDLMKGRSVNLEKTESLVDNWTTVIGIDRHSYCHVARKTVRIYDKRTNNIIQTFGTPGNVSDEYCNHFSVVKKCEDTSLFYAGTNHHLFLLDTRSNSKKKFLQRWTHHMKCVPTYITLCKFEMNKDLICLSSQWYDDMCVLANDSNSFYSCVQNTGVYMPLRPPTIEQTLNSARMKMLCLDIYNPVETRLYMSITGNAVTERNGKYIVLLQNSLGDIVCHTLYPEHMEMTEDDGLQNLHEWCKNIKEVSKTYEVSKVLDIARIWGELRKIPNDHIFNDGDKLVPWEESKYSEEEVVDAFESDRLDSGLLDAWIDERNETAIADKSLTINLHFSDSE